MKLTALFLIFPLMTAAANYSAERITSNGIEVIKLADAAHQTEVSIAPSIGNMAFEMKVKGTNVLYFPFQRIGRTQSHTDLCAVPFLWPWANRLDQDAYLVNGRKFICSTRISPISATTPTISRSTA